MDQFACELVIRDRDRIHSEGGIFGQTCQALADGLRAFLRGERTEFVIDREDRVVSNDHRCAGR